jgi:Tol biopolymer transport system component
MIAWPLVAVAWTVWSIPAEGACDGGRVRVARQKLGGPPPGVATVDVSADGRYVAFVSLARLTRNDDNTVDDVYVLDRVTDRVSLETTVDGRAANGSSEHPRLSADGRVLVYSTIAANLVGVTVGTVGNQVLRRDRISGHVTLVSHTPDGAPGNAWSGHPDVSEDGRYVVFASHATDLVAGGDANLGGSDIYLFDAADGRVRRISLATSGAQLPWGQSSTPAISANGRYVAFASTALLDAPAIPPDGPPATPPRAIFLRDLSTGAVRRISATRGGQPPNGASYYPAISADGQRVAFVSDATNLDDDARAVKRENIYLHDSRAPRLRLVSRGASGSTADGESRAPALSGDGRYVLFSSEASNLHCVEHCGARADLNLVSDVFRADTANGRIDRLSGGTEMARWWTPSSGVASDRTGRVVAFSSREPIDAADLEHDDDLFVEDLSNAGDCTPAFDRF